MEEIMQNNNPIHKIAILGAESTGKTTLCEQLAQHFHTNWVPEYAREYLSNLKRPYTLDDIVVIAKQQLHNQKTALQDANQLLFADTEMIILKIWCEDKFNTCPQFILDALHHQTFQLYLIMANDIPWQSDPLRENPDRRDYLLNLYINELDLLKANYKIINGHTHARLINAINAIY